MTLGQEIKRLRDKRGLSLRVLAKNIGLKSAAFLSDIELGRRYPSQDTLIKIANVFGVFPSHLKRFDDRPAINEIRRLAFDSKKFRSELKMLIEKHTRRIK